MAAQKATEQEKERAPPNFVKSREVALPFQIPMTSPRRRACARVCLNCCQCSNGCMRHPSQNRNSNVKTSDALHHPAPACRLP